MAKHVSAYRGAGLKPNRVTKKPKQDWVSAYKRDEEKNRGGLIGGLGYVGGNLGLGLAGIGEGVGDLISAGGDLLRGDTDMAKYRFLDNQTAEAQQSLREWYNPGSVMEFAGDVASGIGQSSVFLLDAVAPGVGTGLFFAGVGGQGISSAAAQTGDVGWREVGYGVASGVTEGLLEKAMGAGSKVAGKLGASITRKAGTAIGQKGITTALTKSAGKRAWSSIAKATAKDAAGEFAEEFASEYIDTFLLHRFGINPDEPYSFQKAVRAGMVGLFSGGIMGAPANVINYKNAAKAGRTIRESGETENLLNRAQATVSVLREQEAVKKAEGKKVKKTDEGTEAAEQKGFLARQGAKREARRAAEYAAKLEKNVNAYRNMKAEMRNSEVGDALLGELRGNLYFTNMAYAVEEAEIVLRNVDDAQAQKIVDYINTEAKAAKQEKSDYTVEDFRLNRDGILSQFAAKGRMEQLVNGEWTEAEEMAAQAAEATERPVEAAGAAGAVTGEEVGASVKKTNEKAVWTNPGTTEDEKAIYKVAHDFGLSETETNMMLASFKKGTAMDADTFAKAYSEGIFRGRRGQNPADVTPGSLLASMNPYERQEAFEAGRTSAIETEDLREAAAKQKRAPARQADKQGKTSFVTLELAEGVRMRDLSPEAYQTYNAAKVIGEALHTDIVLHSTLGDVNGKKQNGYYNPKTGEIHIALDAGRGANGTALFTLAHEVTHYIKEWSPRKYQALADFVSERISGELDVLVERKVNLLRTLPDYKNMTVSQLNDAAHEEVVADSMETVLSDGNVLEDLATYDNSIWQKVKTWITKAIKNIKAVYESLSPNSRAAQVLSETMTDMEKLERLFTEGVREAGERTRTEEAGVIIDESSGTAMFSIDDIPRNQDEVDAAVNRLVAKLGVDETRARQWVQNELSLATLILRDDMVDYAHRKADRRLTAIVKNSDYKQGTLDFSNICRKRREYTRMMQRIQQAFPNRRFTAEEFATIRKIMVDEGLEVACGLCYVEDRRQNEGYIAETFREAVKSWRSGNRETFRDTKNEEDKAYNKGQTNAMNLIEKGDYLPTIADLTTVEGMEKLQREHPDILRAWRGFNNARGMASARLLTGEAEYQRQIIKYNRARVKQINDLGGLRIFSFSDFEEFHLLDIIQAVQDCAAMGIKIQFYTKVPSFALLMKDTKAKGNLSLIPKGDLGYIMMNGKPVLAYDPVEGIDFNDPAFKKVVRGNPNIGTILVGINDTQIRAAMEDDYIDYIIPFHSGQSTVVRQIKKIGKWENYKDSQTDKKLDPNSKAKPVNIYTDVIAAAEREGDPIRNERQFVERFLKVCKERGLKPRFEQFLKKNEVGEYVYTKGYYKLLLDFKMFDKDGTYLPQEAVIPEFDADLLHELTEKYVAGEKAKTESESPAFKRALKRVTEEVVGEDDGIRYSIDETDENADVSDSAFDEALRRAGLSHLVEDTAEADEIAPPPRKVPQERDPEEDRRDRIRAHETLANALMESAQNENEFRLVKNYQKKIAELADAEIRKDDLIKKTAAVNREIDLLKSKKDSIDRERPEPEVKEAEAWIENELNEAIARKQSFLEELNELDDKLRAETDKLLTLASTKQLRKMFRAERSKAAAMERSAERSRQRELSTKVWAKETVKQAREEANEKKRESREWAKETVRNIRKESNEKIYKARREATEYKAAVYHTAYDKADKRVEKAKAEYEAREEYKENRREMSVRERVARRVIGRLNTMFYSPSRTKHVPADLQALVEAVLKSEKLDTFKDTRKNLRQMAELERDIEKLEQNPARTASEQERLDKLHYKYAMLEDEGLDAKGQAEALYTAFKTWMESRPEGQQDKALLDKLSSEIDKMQEMPLSMMSKKSLEAVEDFYKMIYHQVNTANQAFATEKATGIDQMSTKANTQVKEAKSLKFLSPKPMEITGKNSIRRFFWKNMKPLTVFEAIGSDELMSIFKRVLDGEDVWITDILEAKKALDEAKKKYGYNKWNFKERREVTTADGSKVSLTLGEMMSLYAYMFREQAEEHLSAGGFVFAPDAKAIEKFKDSKVLYEAHLNDQTPHRMRKEDIAKMSEMLTQEQRAYAEAVQKYLTGLGAKGNEVSRKLYGIDLFKETAYFPIKSSHDYIETSTGKSGDPNIKSRGTFKETVPKAGNPIVLEDFMEVVGNHVNTMATYHAFVLPVEDLTRVWNYTPVNIKRDADGKAILDENGMPVADTEGAVGYNSLKAEITKKYGKEANDYILQLLRDLNGGARRESAASILDKGLTAFKRSATMLSLSTIVQQPTSIIRAMAYVDAKHFTGASFVPWETVKKYAPVAAIKEMGGFDTGTGARTAEYINAKEYDSIKDAAKAAVTPEIYGGDPNVRAEAFGWLTGKADEVSWRYMFGAIVNEQAEKLGKPKESEEVMKAAGERFAEVVRRTQVYDSTLTRSEFMRSKDGLMKMATAFGAEPTTVVSMVADAIIKAERGDKTFLRKSAAGIAFSVIANAAVVSLIYAMRDDDEDETIPEKYVQSLTSELIEGFNFFEYLPVARDVVSLFKGYEIERSDMALVGNLMDQVELITSSKRSVPDKIFGVTGAVSAFFGLPVTNVYRDVKGLVKTGQSFTTAEKQTGAGFGFAIGDAVSGQFNLFAKLFGAESGNDYELYTAYVDGDTAHYNRVKARYEDEKAAEQALRKELRENDRRIGEAAKARMNGETEVYESMVRAIVSEGIFDRNMVIRAVNNEISALERELEKGTLVPEDPEAEDTPEALYKASDLNAALERGDRADFELIYDTILGERMEQGKTEAQAKAAMKSSITAYWKKQYLSGYQDTETRKRIIKLLTDTGLYGSRNDVATMCEGWVRASK